MARSRRDVRLLFATRIVRMFAYGALSVVLALYLAEIGLDTERIGLLFTLTLVGDAVVTLAITTSADRLGRRFEDRLLPAPVSQLSYDEDAGRG